MSRPLRIDIADGWYHAMSRGFERRLVFCGDRDCAHFLELLAEGVTRYGIKIHAYVLLENHYHLLVQTPHANLSRLGRGGLGSGLANRHLGSSDNRGGDRA